MTPGWGWGRANIMNRRDLLKMIGVATLTPAVVLPSFSCSSEEDIDDDIKDRLYKTRLPNQHYDGDIIAGPEKISSLSSALKRLKRLQSTVGYGNFNVLSFDDAIKTAGKYSKVGKFSQTELQALEEVFYGEAEEYGFFGEKPVDELTSHISRKDIIKVPRSGHFLYRGEAQAMFEKVRSEVGPSLVLTSGVRSVTKQMYLFLRKASHYDWNLSLASRSLAPPGYSFHGVGDFDVGKKGFASKNFTSDFAMTAEYKKLVDLGYIKIRYPLDNQLGVRFEPWHIKVV